LIKSHVGKGPLLNRRCGLLREKAPHDARPQRLEAAGVMFIAALRFRRARTPGQTIEGAKISASSTLRKIIRCLERREFFHDRIDDKLVQRRTIFASNPPQSLF
jgi:hypothetical protein